MTIRVVIADDHPVFVTGLTVTLDACDDIEIVATVNDGQGAIAASSEWHPDVILMDIRMTPVNGIEATRAISAADPSVAILVLTMFDDDESVFTAMAAGARGYLVKGAAQERIVDSVRSVAAGQVVFGQGVAGRVLAFFSEDRTVGAMPFPTLTDRERQVLERIAAGRNNQAIARELSLSEKTVRNHVSSIFAKLHVADRSEAIVRAREAGLGGARPR